MSRTVGMGQETPPQAEVLGALVIKTESSPEVLHLAARFSSMASPCSLRPGPPNAVRIHSDLHQRSFVTL